MTDKDDSKEEGNKGGSKDTGGNILTQTIFGLHEVFANILPGLVVIFLICLFTGHNFFSTSGAIFSESATQLTFLVAAAFIIGFTLQGIYKLFENIYRYVYKRRPNKKLSDVYLAENNEQFPNPFKKVIREKAAKVIDAPISEADWKNNKAIENSYVFSICHTYLIQEKAETRAQIFQRMRSLAKSMVAAMFVALIPLWWGVINNPSVNLFMGVSISLSLLLLSYVFHLLCKTYDKAFVKEVLTRFLVIKNSKNEHVGNRASDLSEKRSLESS